MSEIKNALLDYDRFIAYMNIDHFRSIAKRKDYTIFDKGNYNLNIWGIRCNTDDTKEFNDLLCVFYKANESNPKLNGKWVYDWYLITTDPSDMNLIKPINNKGCAILKECQVRAAFKYGWHKGDYRALVQNKPLPLYRDNNKDSKIDFDESTVKWEMAGINIHRASKWKIVRTIGLYSAGCQVFESVRDYEDKFIPVIEQARKLHGDYFTYTLININDIFKEFHL